ncbi:MAG TPA: glycosyltransferase family 39 protein, partial [Terriglobales bacterium]
MVYEPSANIHRFNLLPIVALSVLGTALLLVFANQYGIFRDELYYYACSQNLAFGYVDQPPLCCWLMWLVTHTIGKSLFAIRLLPALAFGASIYLTARIAQQLEGGSFAMLSAALLTLCMPLALGLSHLYTMNAFDFPLWALIVWLLLRLENTRDARLWIVIGAVVGITILNKYAILFFVAALLLAMALTSWRRWFAAHEFWFGAILATLIAIPNLIWQAVHHFPFLELMANIKRSGRDISPPPVQFAIQQFQIANPMGFILAIIGAIWLLSHRRYRALGIVFFAFYVLLEFLGAKNYYLGPIYPFVFAAGAVVLERAPRWLALTALVIVVTVPAIMLPVLIPVLSPEKFIAYEKALHYEPPKFEHTASALPQ